MRVHVLPGAVADLTSIFKFIARNNRSRAISFTWELQQKIEALAHMAESFPLVAIAASHGIRRRIHGRYKILFRISPQDDFVEVLRVLHSAQNPELEELC